MHFSRIGCERAHPDAGHGSLIFVTNSSFMQLFSSFFYPLFSPLLSPVRINLARPRCRSGSRRWVRGRFGFRHRGPYWTLQNQQNQTGEPSLEGREGRAGRRLRRRPWVSFSHPLRVFGWPVGASDPGGTPAFPGAVAAARDARLLLAVASLREAEAKGHVPTSCASTARWPHAPGCRAGSFPPAVVLPLFSCLSMEAEVWVASFHLPYCSAPCRGQAGFIADPLFRFCLPASALTLPSATGSGAAGPTPALRSWEGSGWRC